MKKFPQSLIEGYQNFLADFDEKPLFYRRLAEEGQKPETMVIGCCDSRVAPEIIFNMGPGDMFVTRNIANQIPPYQPDGHFHATSAALEYAVKGLEVKHIIVLGHSRCGGIEAALEGVAPNEAHANNGGQPCAECTPSPKIAASFTNNGDAADQNENYDFIGDWMQLLKPAAEAAAANALMTQYERRQALERISLRSSIYNLRGFPWIKEAEDKGALTLHAAWFDISSGELWLMDGESEQFVLLPSKKPVKIADNNQPLSAV